MDYLIISVSALAASCLTLFSGFGLGTLLTPVFALFFPVTTAIAMTAVVHLANNLFKIGLVGKDAHLPTVIRFGLPAAIAAVLGAFTLSLVAGLSPWIEYEFLGVLRQVTPIKASVGLLIVVFALLELSPAFARLSFPPQWLPVGGLVSGFFGGLSGNQGAIRSAFLVKAGLSKEAYVGTGALCTVLVDTVRLVAYGFTFGTYLLMVQGSETGLAVLVATGSAFVGAYFGKRLLTKVTLRVVELAVATMMVLIGSGLASGLL